MIVHPHHSFPQSADPGEPPTRLRDRAHAAQLIAAALVRLRGSNPLVLAVPRGALPMGRVIADALDGELDVVLAHKLGAPGNPEFAIGAVDESGRVYLDPSARYLVADEGYIRHETDRQIAVLRERATQYRRVRPPADPAGRTVIVVDDGAATGATLLAALAAVRAQGPRHLIAALGVTAPDTRARLAEAADEVVCPLAPMRLHAVGQYFDEFDQVTDAEALAALAGHGRPAQRGKAPH